MKFKKKLNNSIIRQSKMGNSKSIGLFKVSYKNLYNRMRVVGTYLGYGKMLLELGEKKKIKLPCGKKY